MREGSGRGVETSSNRTRDRRSSCPTLTLQPLVAACGLPKIRLHDLRHNVASLLLATGMPFASVMKITGTTRTP